MTERNRIDLSRVGVEDILILGVIVALPWFFGGVEPTSYRSAAAVIALAASVALARGGLSALVGRRTVWLLPAFLLGAFAFAQALPIPRALVAAVSPTAARIETEAFGPGGQNGQAWLRGIEVDARGRVPEAAGSVPDDTTLRALGPVAPAPPRGFTLSLRPDATIESAFWYAALLLAFLVVYRRTASESRARVYRATFFALIGALAVLGILSHLSAPGTILWFRGSPEQTHPFGPYVNPDHFAAVMELGVPWVLGYGLVAVAHRGSRLRMRVGRALALAVGGLGLVAALLAASKAAALTITLCSSILLFVSLRHASRRARWRLLAGAAAAALMLAAVAASGRLGGRVADFLAVEGRDPSISIGGRGLAWAAGLNMANQFALAGSGFGAFPAVFPSYAPRGGAGVWLQLHNDYLEIYSAGGLIAIALVSWLVVVFAMRAVRVLRGEAARDRGLPALGLVLGLLALAAHEVVDFSLQIPANALLFIAFAAMSVSGLAREGDVP